MGPERQNQAPMESRLARQAEAELLETMRRMTPEQKLNAFLEHCQLVMELYTLARNFARCRRDLTVRSTGPGQSALLLPDVVERLVADGVRALSRARLAVSHPGARNQYWRMLELTATIEGQRRYRSSTGRELASRPL